MKATTPTTTSEALLRRRGLAFIDKTGPALEERYVQAVEVRLSELGYALSTRLRARMLHLPLAALTELQEWMYGTLAAALGANRVHEPLFRKFPDDVPKNTGDLWMKKVLVHFCQGAEQPCLFCGKTGTTHVLKPCYHVVCGNCFDGSNYSACPVCERTVDRSSPFFLPAPRIFRRPEPKEFIKFTRLDLGDDLDTEARALFVSFCERKQAMSPTDRDIFEVLLEDYRERALPWIPESIPVKENIATVFGTLFRLCPPETIWPAAKRHLKTATDLLRFIAAYSGADPSLQAQTATVTVTRLVDVPPSFWRTITSDVMGVRTTSKRDIQQSAQVDRFKMARMPRPLRRTLLEFLESLDKDLLIEDMLRHRSYWVWVGEFLHPHEYAKRFPRVAEAFAVVRKRAPGGSKAPAFQTYAAKLESAASKGDGAAFTDLLLARPGEFARRFDHALRVSGNDAAASDRLLREFEKSSRSFSTPVLLTLRNLLPTRSGKAPVRIFWPKGAVVKAISSPDTRPPLSPGVIHRAVEAVESELLRRFAEKSPLGDCVIDRSLKDIMAPFNERTASRSAISLPRGSRVAVADGEIARLFLHWREPESGGKDSDLDLSVGFYDAEWKYVGVCSYYELTCTGPGRTKIAVSAGDLRNAPFPKGATEFIDIYKGAALAAGVRYAVMVVTNYAGMPFSALESGFAGIMLRQSSQGAKFDPQTVKLKFAIQGENGVFLPLVYDLEENCLHWLDAYSKGDFQFNNVENANSAITKVCPEMLAYFGSGVRMSMFELACLHAAARGRRVYLRGGDGVQMFERGVEETYGEFLTRLKSGTADKARADLPSVLEAPVFAALEKGDLALEDGAMAYVLFPEQTHGTIAASDLIG